MHIEELTVFAGKEKKWLDVDAVGADLGFSSHDSRLLVDLLIDAGWVAEHPTQVPGASPKIRMTKTGLDEVAKLRLPRPMRWLSKHAAIIALVISMIALLVGMAGFVQRFFF
jgi:hypothetical protein